jgi:hypothetical protein
LRPSLATLPEDWIPLIEKWIADRRQPSVPAASVDPDLSTPPFLRRALAAKKRNHVMTARSNAAHAGQFDPFRENAPAPSDPVIGLAVRMPHDPCRCGATAAEIGAGRGAHSPSLRCFACGAHRGWISHATHKFLTEIVDKFGRPETPIVIQRGTNKGFAAESGKDARRIAAGDVRIT